MNRRLDTGNMSAHKIKSLGNCTRDLLVLDEILMHSGFCDIEEFADNTGHNQKSFPFVPPRLKGVGKVAKKYGISPARVRQITIKAVIRFIKRKG